MPREKFPALPDLRFMVRPAEAYLYLSKGPGAATRWIGLRRPLLMCAVLGCAISLIAEGRITLRLALPAAVAWSFVPLLLALCVIVSHRRARLAISLARAIDLSFRSVTPWLFWLILYASQWVLLPPARVYALPDHVALWYGLAILAGVWSAYIDFWYFRVIFGKTRAGAGLSILFHRVVCWSVGLVIFVWSAGWQTVAGGLGL
jgi:hypothetical protein